MYDYFKSHEAFIEKALKEPKNDWEYLATYHLTQIGIIQHERLIHLLVTLFFAFLLLCSATYSVLSPMLPLFLLDGILFIVLLFYIRHYYRLENGLAYWYKLYEELESKRHPL